MKFWCLSTVIAIALAVATPLVGCSGTMESGGTGGAPVMGGTGGSAPCVPPSDAGTSAIPPTFDTIKLVLGGGGAIQPCAAAPCHAVGGNAPPGRPLTLQNNAQLYANMTSFVSTACGNIKLIEPGHPDQSALVKILQGPCGATPRMPYQCSDDACIPPEYIAAVAQWITNCAPEH